jgi:hypothetical protein
MFTNGATLAQKPGAACATVLCTPLFAFPKAEGSVFSLRFQMDFSVQRLIVGDEGCWEPFRSSMWAGLARIQVKL